MADLFTTTVESAALDKAIADLPGVLDAKVDEACRATAAAATAEMQARLRRQLSPNATGKTVAGIHFQEAYDGNGYVILSDRGFVAGEPEQIPNLPLWLEKGTKPGRRRNFARTPAFPFFYVSLRLEAPAHERRMVQAMIDAAAAVGLGD